MNEREEFYGRIDHHHMAPLWESLHQLVSRTPQSPAVPHLWRYSETRPFVMEAGRLITAREAERRVLILENPGRRGKAAITHSLYAGLQLVLPGDVAPPHRHSQSALRFILEGADAHTTVNGERTLMRPGDLVITPSWSWHEHGNGTAQPMVWLDVLDIPTVGFFDASFSEGAGPDYQPVLRPDGDSGARYGANLFPVDWRPDTQSCPVFSYPYSRARESLHALARNGAPDPCHGHKMRYVNPATGGHVTPTIAAFIQLLPAGFVTAPYRSTDGTVFVVAEGEGETVIGDQRFSWSPCDVFVVPSWTTHHHRAAGDTVLFSVSDRSAQEKIGLWREEHRAP